MGREDTHAGGAPYLRGEPLARVELQLPQLHAPRAPLESYDDERHRCQREGLPRTAHG